jgi:hypothetical protein
MTTQNIDQKICHIIPKWQSQDVNFEDYLACDFVRYLALARELCFGDCFMTPGNRHTVDRCTPKKSQAAFPAVFRQIAALKQLRNVWHPIALTTFS